MKDHVVTIDAIGMQKAIAKKIINKNSETSIARRFFISSLPANAERMAKAG